MREQNRILRLFLSTVNLLLTILATLITSKYMRHQEGQADNANDYICEQPYSYKNKVGLAEHINADILLLLLQCI
jgi:hypothetical protein